MGSFNVNMSNIQPALRGLPQGEYALRVAEVDHQPSKKNPGTMRTNVRCEVMHDIKGDVTLQGKSQWHGFNEDDVGAPYFRSFVGALGITDQDILAPQYNGVAKASGEVTDAMLHGRMFVGRVFINPAGFSNITGERPMDASVQQPRGSQPIGAPPTGGGLLQGGQPAGFGQPPQRPPQQPLQGQQPQGGFPGQPQDQPQAEGIPQQSQPQGQPQAGFPQGAPVGQPPGQQMPQGQPQGQPQGGFPPTGFPPQGQPQAGGIPGQPGGQSQSLPAPAPPPGQVGGQWPGNQQ